jgi:hypothetical protein
LCIEGIAPLGRAPAFLVKDDGDLAAVVTCVSKLFRARQQAGVGTERAQPRHRSRQLVRRAIAAVPMAFNPNLLGAVDHLDQDPFE